MYVFDFFLCLGFVFLLLFLLLWLFFLVIQLFPSRYLLRCFTFLFLTRLFLTLDIKTDTIEKK